MSAEKKAITCRIRVRPRVSLVPVL